MTAKIQKKNVDCLSNLTISFQYVTIWLNSTIFYIVCQVLIYIKRPFYDFFCIFYHYMIFLWYSSSLKVLTSLSLVRLQKLWVKNTNFYLINLSNQDLLLYFIKQALLNRFVKILESIKNPQRKNSRNQSKLWYLLYLNFI